MVPFDATVYEIVPFPLPLAPAVIVIQPALLEAVQVQACGRGHSKATTATIGVEVVASGRQ